MSGFQIMDLFEPSSSVTYRQASVFRPKASSLLFPFPPPFLVEEEELGLGFSLDLLNPKPPTLLDLIYSPPSPFEIFESAIDLIQAEKSAALSSAFKRYQERRDTELYLQHLTDRVSALELGLDQALKAKKVNGEDRKYKWVAEYKGPENGGVEKKYKWLAEITQAKGKDGKLTGGVEKSLKWTSSVKGKGMDSPISKSYTFKSTAAPSVGAVTAEKPKKKKKQPLHLVEIEEPVDAAALALKQIFEKRRSSVIKKDKGKKKELSPQDAAFIIQVYFRAYLVHRSQALRELRELAVAKAKLKEIRARFNNFSYRRCIATDAEEKQRFSEKIIVLLLTVDAIEGADYMVRSAKRSMVAELEAMLDVVDPQPPGKLGSLKRRKFDLPEAGPIGNELALGVAEVMQMLDQRENGSSAVPVPPS